MLNCLCKNALVIEMHYTIDNGKVSVFLLITEYFEMFERFLSFYIGIHFFVGVLKLCMAWNQCSSFDVASCAIIIFCARTMDTGHRIVPLIFKIST